MSFLSRRSAQIAVAALFGLLTASAHAAPLTALEVLQQFNLVTLGDAASSSHVDGRAYIGGNLSGNNAVMGMHPDTVPKSNYTALTVRGNAAGTQVTAGGMTVLGDASNDTVNNGVAAIAGNASKSSFNGTGGSYVGGKSSGNNANSGKLAGSQAAAQFETAGSTNMAEVLGSASLSLAAFTGTGSYWDVKGSRVTFHAVADKNGVAVFDLSPVDELLGYGEFAFDLGGASSVIFNSDITSGTIAANFLGGSAQAIASRVIWNFYSASSLNLNAQFGGSVLAPQATLTNRNNIEGGVFVKGLNQQGEIHQGAYTGVLPQAQQRQTVSGEVPEPASLGLVALALAACAAARSRRRAAPQAARVAAAATR
jgi:choice-of-anchor A domain-containing protein